MPSFVPPNGFTEHGVPNYAIYGSPVKVSPILCNTICAQLSYRSTTTTCRLPVAAIGISDTSSSFTGTPVR